MHITMLHWSIWKPLIQKKPMNSQILSLAVIHIFDVWTFSLLMWGVVILLHFTEINMPKLSLLQLEAFCISQNAFDNCKKTAINLFFSCGFYVLVESDIRIVTNLYCGCIPFWSIEATMGWRMWYNWCASSTMDISMFDCWLLVLYGSSRENHTFLFDIDGLTLKPDVYSWCF